MTQLAVAGLDKRFGAHQVLSRPQPRRARGLADRDPRPVRQRQDHPAAGAGRVRARRRGHGADRRRDGRRAGRVPPPGTAADRLRAAGRQPVPAPHRGRQRRVRAEPPHLGAGPARPALRGTAGGRRARRPGPALPAPAVRRPAAAGRAGPGARHRAGGRPARRAVRLARREPAGQCPGRRAAAAEGVGHHHRPGHPRPGRGPVHRGPGGGAAGRRYRPVRRPAGAVLPPGRRGHGPLHRRGQPDPRRPVRHVRADGAGPARRDRARSRGGRRRGGGGRGPATAATARGSGRPWC